MTTRLRYMTGWGKYPKIPTILQCKIPESIQNQSIFRGQGRSYADQAICETGYTIENNTKKRILSFNNGLLEIESGITFKEILDVFVPKGFTIPICPGTQYLTIGGAIANDIHGKGHHIDGSFVNCVHSFNLHLVTGEILTCSRTENADVFWANVGGCGLLGYIGVCKIQLSPIASAYINTVSYKANNFGEMMELLDNQGLKYHYTVGWINTQDEKLPGVLSCGNRHIPDFKDSNLLHTLRKKPIHIPEIIPNGMVNKFSVSFLNRFISFTQLRKNGLIHSESFNFPLDRLANWNYGYGSNGFCQFQFLVPLQNGMQNLTLIFKAIRAANCTSFLNVVKRFGTATGRYLSFPDEGYTLALDFAIDAKTILLCKHLNTLIAKMGGKVYLAKDAFLNPEQFREMYPNFEKWMKIKTALDPNGYLVSAQAIRLNIK